MKTASILLLSCFAIACSKPAAEPPAAMQPDISASPRSGALTLAPGVLRFIPCGDSGNGVIIADRPDSDATRLIGEFAPADGRLTALVRIDHDSLREIRYAGVEGPKCGDLPAAGDLVASGTEPFWHLRVSAGVATLRTPDDTAGVSWNGGSWTSADAGHRRFVATRAGNDTLTLELTAERCADGMSGARYPFHAELAQRGVTMKGCALDGPNAWGGTP